MVTSWPQALQDHELEEPSVADRLDVSSSWMRPMELGLAGVLRARSGSSSSPCGSARTSITAVSMTDTCLPPGEVRDLVLGADAEQRLAVDLLVHRPDWTTAWRPPVFASRQMRCIGLTSAKPRRRGLEDEGDRLARAWRGPARVGARRGRASGSPCASPRAAQASMSSRRGRRADRVVQVIAASEILQLEGGGVHCVAQTGVGDRALRRLLDHERRAGAAKPSSGPTRMSASTGTNDER